MQGTINYGKGRVVMQYITISVKLWIFAGQPFAAGKPRDAHGGHAAWRTRGLGEG
jgi:hypothetical protein